MERVSGGREHTHVEHSEDQVFAARINALAAREHELFARAGHGRALTPAEAQELREVQVRLDQCWDALRRHRARPSGAGEPVPTGTRGGAMLATRAR